MNNPIVIIGAGFGGLCAAMKLAKYKDHLDREIIIIDRGEHLLYSPLLYEVATGYDSREEGKAFDREVEIDLSAGAMLSYDYLIGRLVSAGVRFVRGEVSGIDWQNREIIISGEQRVIWSYLVLALGGETDFYGIGGLAEHSFQLKNLRQALAIRRRLREAIMKRQRGEQSHISVVVGGAGATGIEFTAELVKFFDKAIQTGLISKSDVTINVVEAASRVLSMFDKKFFKWAKRRLENWGVKIYLDSCILSVAKNKVVIAPRPLKSGETVESLVCEFRTEKQKEIIADALIWTGGIRAPASLKNWGFEVDRKGRAEVNEYCEIKDRKDVYAIGDCAAMINPKTNQPVPALAQAAMEQAHIVAENITAAIIKGSKTAYTFPYLHTIIPLGAKYALADIGGYKFHGFMAWVVRQIVDFRYWLHILPFVKAVKISWKGVRMYTRND